MATVPTTHGWQNVAQLTPREHEWLDVRREPLATDVAPATLRANDAPPGNVRFADAFDTRSRLTFHGTAADLRRLAMACTHALDCGRAMTGAIFDTPLGVVIQRIATNESEPSWPVGHAPILCGTRDAITKVVAAVANTLATRQTTETRVRFGGHDVVRVELTATQEHVAFTGAAVPIHTSPTTTYNWMPEVLPDYTYASTPMLPTPRGTMTMADVDNALREMSTRDRCAVLPLPTMQPLSADIHDSWHARTEESCVATFGDVRFTVASCKPTHASGSRLRRYDITATCTQHDCEAGAQYPLAWHRLRRMVEAAQVDALALPPAYCATPTMLNARATQMSTSMNAAGDVMTLAVTFAETLAHHAVDVCCVVACHVSTAAFPLATDGGFALTNKRPLRSGDTVLLTNQRDRAENGVYRIGVAIADTAMASLWRCGYAAANVTGGLLWAGTTWQDFDGHGAWLPQLQQRDSNTLDAFASMYGMERREPTPPQGIVMPYAPRANGTPPTDEQPRHVIDRMLRDDARREPAFATARNVAVMSAFELYGSVVLVTKPTDVARLLRMCHEYERLRGGQRTPTREAVDYMGLDVDIACYERARSIP